MSTTGFLFKHLRNNREREIYLLAFWDGVCAGDDLKREMRELEREWSNGGQTPNLQATVQQSLREIQKG